MDSVKIQIFEARTRWESSAVYHSAWELSAKAAETYEGVKKLFVEEQYLRSCPKEMSMHPREGKPKTLNEQKLTMRLTPVISFLGSIRSSQRSENLFKFGDVISVVLRITVSTTVHSHNLLRNWEYHCSKNQVMVSLNRHLINEDRSGVTTVTG